MIEMQNEDSVFFWNPLGDLADPNPKRWPRTRSACESVRRMGEGEV